VSEYYIEETPLRFYIVCNLLLHLHDEIDGIDVNCNVMRYIKRSWHSMQEMNT
jgi:hypothetical protein